MVRPWLAIVLLTLGLGCGRGGGDHSPSATLTQFLEAMERSSVDSGALREAYGLLDARAREALSHRAQLAQNLAGREFEPWDMLAQGRFRLRFDPTARMRAKVDGDRAVITVESASGEQSAQIQTVREDGSWRIRLEVPPPRRTQPLPTAPAPASRGPSG